MTQQVGQYKIILEESESEKNDETNYSTQATSIPKSTTFPAFTPKPHVPQTNNHIDKIVGTFVNEGRASHGRTVNVGSRGGHYTMTANYNKTYLNPKEVKFSISYKKQ